METNKSFQEPTEKSTFETNTVRKSVMEVFEGNIPHVCEPKIKSFLAQYINNALNEKTDPEKIKAVARVFSDLNTSLKNSSIAKIIYDEFSGSKDPNTLINNIYAILIQKKLIDANRNPILENVEKLMKDNFRHIKEVDPDVVIAKGRENFLPLTVVGVVLSALTIAALNWYLTNSPNNSAPQPPTQQQNKN